MANRVGIMSMQRIFNYGSTLQAYGLRRIIENVDHTAEVRFVDYRPGKPLVVDPHAKPPRTRAGRALGKVREYSRIDAPLIERARFFNHKRKYPSRNFPAVDIPLAPDHDLDLDLQVIGSDEVFNCVQANTNVGYARDLFGHGSPASRLITYAASFGNTTLAKIEQFDLTRELGADLSRFEYLSVRDRNSATIVEALTGRAPSVNVDPVIAYDFMTLESRIPVTRPTDCRYLVVYGYSGRLTSKENAVLREFADKRGLQIFAFGGVQTCADRFIDCNPFELLAWFRDAEAVVTDTFHGTIFSLINHRPFATIVRTSSGHGYGNEEKITHLLRTFGLRSHGVSDLACLAEVLDTAIDPATIDTKIGYERRRAIDYLRSAVVPSAHHGQPIR